MDALRSGPEERVFTPMLLSTTAVPGLRGDSAPADLLLRRPLAERILALRIATAEVQRAERTVRGFAIAGLPDFTVRLQAAPRFGGRDPFVTALVGTSVSLWAAGKQTPAAEAARLDADEAHQRVDGFALRLTAEADAAAAALQALSDRILLTADEIPLLAEAASLSALQRYQVTKLESSAVLDAQDDPFRAQLRLARPIAYYGALWGNPAALVGEEWYR